jgi:predicted metal-binding membrane protein
MWGKVALPRLAASCLRQLRHAVWRHPEWWSIAGCTWAWLYLSLAGTDTGSVWAASMHHQSDSRALSLTLMILAMMVPLLIRQIQWIARSSLWARRNVAIAQFLIGYVSIWSPFVLIVDTVAGRLEHTGSVAYLTATAFLVATVWQFSSVKRRALLTCHRTVPLAPRGWKADRDCIEHGLRTGANCFRSCWALMLAVCILGHPLPVLAAATLISLAERQLKPVSRGSIAMGVAVLGLFSITSLL